MQIPVYEQQTSLNSLGVTPQANTSPGLAPGTLSTGLEAVGKGFESQASGQAEYASALDRSAQAQATARVAATTAQKHLEWLQYTNAKSIEAAKAGEGAPDFAADMLKEFQTQAKASIANETNPHARMLMQTQMTNLASTLMPTWMHTEATERTKYLNNNYSNMLGDFTKIVDLDKTQYPGVMRAVNSILESDTQLYPAEREAFKEKITQTLGNVAVSKYVRDDPLMILRLAGVRPDEGPAAAGITPPEGEVVPGLSPAAMQGLARDIKASPGQSSMWTDTKNGATDKREVIVGSDGQVRYKAPLKPDLPLPLIAGPMMDAGNGTQTAALIPDTQTQPKSVADADRDINAVTKQAWGTLTHPEREHYIVEALRLSNQANAIEVRQFKKRIEGDGALAMQGNPQPETMHPPLSEFQRLLGKEPGLDEFNAYKFRQAVGGDIKGMDTMPTPDILAKLKEREPTMDPMTAKEDLASYHALSLAAQQSIKLRTDSPADFAMRGYPELKQLFNLASSKDATPSVVQNYIDASIATQQRLSGTDNYRVLPDEWLNKIEGQLNTPSNGDSYGQAVQKMTDLFGPHFQDAMGDLYAAKRKVPDAVTGITAVPNSPWAKARIAETATGDIKDMEKNIDPMMVKQLKTAVDKQMGPLLSGIQQNDMGIRTSNALVQTAMRMGLAELREKPGATNMDDIATMVTRPFLAEWGIKQNAGDPERAALIPIKENPDKVWQGAGLVVNKLDKLSLQIPFDLRDIYKGDEGKDKYMASVKAHPIWLVNPRNTGMVLYHKENDGATRAVMMPSGKQFGYDFDSFRAMVEFSPNYGIGAMTGRQRETKAIADRQALEAELQKKTFGQ